MPETKTEDKKTYDPLEPFREMRDAYLDSMSKAMIDVMNTESYAQATGAMLECYLTASAPFRDALEKSMLKIMEQLSLPSRQELASLAERFTNVEMRLDDMDAKLDNLAKELVAMRQDRDAKLDNLAKELVATRQAASKEPAASHPKQGATQQPRRSA
jgi:hypothetical protein